MRLLPALGATVFLFMAQLAMRAYGVSGGVALVLGACVLWVTAYLWKERLMDRVWRELNALPSEERAVALSRADKEFRAAMERRDRKLNATLDPPKRR